MSFYKEFDLIVSNYLKDKDRKEFVRRLNKLHTDICSSPDDAMFRDLFTNLKISINDLIRIHQKKLDLEV